MKSSHLIESEALKIMKNRPKLKNAPKATFRARDAFPDLQLIALIRDPRKYCMSMKFGIYIHSHAHYFMQYKSSRNITLFSISGTRTRPQTSNI